MLEPFHGSTRFHLGSNSRCVIRAILLHEHNLNFAVSIHFKSNIFTSNRILRSKATAHCNQQYKFEQGIDLSF